MSEILEGRQLTSASNGRCDGSTGGGLRSLRYRRFTRKKSLSKEEIEGAEEEVESGFETSDEGLLFVRIRWTRGGGVRVPNPSS